MAEDFDGDDEPVGGPVDAGPPRPKGEGVRIIGAEEAAAALESGTASPRQPDDVPKYGDRPAPPDTSKARGKDITPILSARTRPSPWGASDDNAEADLDAPVTRQPGPGLRERLRQRQPEDVGSTQPINLSASEGPASAGGPSGSGPALPHWTEPPTGEVPRIPGGNDGRFRLVCSLRALGAPLAGSGRRLGRVGLRRHRPFGRRPGPGRRPLPQ